MSKPGGVLKAVNKYLLQAKKIDAVDPIIGYYCRFYAAQRAWKLKESPQDLNVVNELITWCEKNRQLRGITLTNEEGRSRMESFALSIFAAADTEDREGRANQSTAAKFFTAFVLFDCCRQFDDLATDIEQKIKYAAWKATDITRALKEGRVPQAGGFEDSFDGLNDQSSQLNINQSSQPSQSSSQSSSQSNQSAAQPASQSSAVNTYPKHGSAQPAGQYSASQSNKQQSFDAPSNSYTPVSNPANNMNTNQSESSSSMPAAYNPAAFGSPSADVGAAHPFTQAYNQQPSPSPVQPSPSPQPRAAPHPAPSHHTHATHPPPHIRAKSPPSTAKTRPEAVREVDRMLKHAASALSFDDIRTTCEKLEAALSMLQPYR